MSQHANTRWLVAYDIADPRRLGRVFRYLKKQGVPLQYSVFMVEASAVKMESLFVQLSKMVNAQTDDVRAYRLPVNAWQAKLGSSILPEDLLL